MNFPVGLFLQTCMYIPIYLMEIWNCLYLGFILFFIAAFSTDCSSDRITTGLMRSLNSLIEDLK